MIKISLKQFLSQIQSEKIQQVQNDNPNDNPIQNILRLINKDVTGKMILEEQKWNQLNHQEIQRNIILDRILKEDTQPINQDFVQVQLMKQEKNQSDTDSLSFIKESQSNVKFMESLQWFQFLGQQEKIFQPYMFNYNFFVMKKIDENKNFDDFDLIIDKGQNTIIYSGLKLDDETPIAIKQLSINNNYLELAQQFIIHQEICELYPNNFLKLLLPVFISSISSDQVCFISQMEYGEINLFKYSQQHKISNSEYQMIFQQIHNQIVLLHQNNIAHRDIKPQNIIFVKNKGWVLCDFGDALKYEKQQSIYNVRGTFGFIPQNIYNKSKTGDVLIQQDLLYNDLYALGITLLIIKYQIKKSSDIQLYLDKQDEIIQCLIGNYSFKQIDELKLKQSYEYLPLLQNQSKQNIPRQICVTEILEYLQIIIINQNLPQTFIEKLIREIDKFLEMNANNHKIIWQIYQYAYLCPDQLNRYINIPNLKTFRSINFWKQMQKVVRIVDQQQIIQFMDQLGFIDLVLQFGFNYLNSSYSFSIHLIIIKLLVLLQERDRALNEYITLLRFREQQFMSDEEVLKLIQISLFMFNYGLVDINEFSYLAKQNMGAVRFDIRELNLCLESSDETIINTIISEFEQFQKLSISHQYDLITTLNLKKQTCNIFGLSLNDKLYDRINQKQKYTSTAFHHQDSLKESIINKILLSQYQRIKKIKKQMNYLLIHNSESTHQFSINNLLKQYARLFQKIKKPKFKQILSLRVQHVLQAFQKLPFRFYKIIVIKEIVNILDEFFLILDICWLKIAILSTRLIDQFITVCDKSTIQLLMMNILKILQKTKNIKRMKLLNNLNVFQVNKQYHKLFQLNMDRRLLKIRIQNKKYKLIQKQFWINQYLQRSM